MTATAEEIMNSFGLYKEMIKLMTAANGKAPMGSCCGKNKKAHINDFMTNKEKYIIRMKAIKERKIQPLWRGILYVTKAGRHYNRETITDAESKYLIEKGFLTPVEKYFQVPPEEEPEVKEEAPKPKKKRTKKNKTVE